ncbi:hypothetical protein BDV34DRAFT_220767 [Aspergillus parasiticus]|uniref:Uncharacterized protein n=1 Tax=Aspergillus parasiticus TaxID=5067 RepID=A0A5N6DY89_ASPPA|nr:hypothetical protein BDV34DRAFT_220767 [Aspergillus parasiticus]
MAFRAPENKYYCSLSSRSSDLALDSASDLSGNEDGESLVNEASYAVAKGNKRQRVGSGKDAKITTTGASLACLKESTTPVAISSAAAASQDNNPVLRNRPGESSISTLRDAVRRESEAPATAKCSRAAATMDDSSYYTSDDDTSEDNTSEYDSTVDATTNDDTIEDDTSEYDTTNDDTFEDDTTEGEN